MAASYNRAGGDVGADHAVGAGHAREQKGTGIGYLLVPEHKVPRMAASYNAPVRAGLAREQKGTGIGSILVPEHKVPRMAASYNAPVRAGHAREQRGTGIGFRLVPEQKMSPAWRLYVPPHPPNNY